MGFESVDESRETRNKSEEKYETLLSALNEKERDLTKSIEKLEEKLAVRRLKSKIQAKQIVIAQLEKKKDKLEIELKELENKLISDENETESTEENEDIAYIRAPFELDYGAKEEVEEPLKKKVSKLFSHSK
jgi:septal ring factor EnvC (AmiA/AmiB activator)